MDILQELPVEKWPILQEKLKSLWPLNLQGYYFLYTSLNYPKVREAFQFKVYCPHGDMNNGFVGVSIKRKGVYEYVLYSLTEDTSVIEEAIIKTKLIDWSKTVAFDPVTSLTLKCVERVKDAMKCTKFDVIKVTMFLLEKTMKPFVDLRLPAETYTAPVKQEHVQRLHETWPHRHADSYTFFATFVSSGLSYGLYSETHELLAWVTFNDGGFLCHLYCEEGHRRKGYAEFVLKWAANERLRQGNDVYGYVVHGNEKSMGLFKKTGFKAVDNAAFVSVAK